MRIENAEVAAALFLALTEKVDSDGGIPINGNLLESDAIVDLSADVTDDGESDEFYLETITRNGTNVRRVFTVSIREITSPGIRKA